MNRFKSRIWDKIGKVYRGNLYKYLINAHSGELEVWSFSDLYDEWYNTHESDEHLVVQQYTGLKDSKGVEIYEGDIVDCKYDDEKVIAEIKYSEEYAAFLCGENALWQGWLGKAEVIGNIFENSEIIKNHE
jgi:hypothetical protein